MLRRLHHDQPESFAFTPANLDWAKAQLTKYPEGRQASAVIPLLWRAQEQEGWLSRPAIEHVADMLGMAYIRVLEVATFYFMFQLAPGRQRRAFPDLRHAVVHDHGRRRPDRGGEGKDRARAAHAVGGRAVQLGRGRMPRRLHQRADDPGGQGFLRGPDRARPSARSSTSSPQGQVPVPGPQNGRYAAEPLGGLTSLPEFESGRTAHNASRGAGAGHRRHGEADRRHRGAADDALAVAAGRKVQVSGRKAAGRSRRPRPKPKADDAGEGGRSAAGADARPPPRPRRRRRRSSPQAARRRRAAARPTISRRSRASGRSSKRCCTRSASSISTRSPTWTAAEVGWVDENLEGFKGRVSRDNWVDQAKLLADGGETEFSKKVKKGGVYSSS